MKIILVLGAGLSASSLIRYLLEHSTAEGWIIHVVDQSSDMARKKLNGHPNGVALTFNALNPEERRPEIEKADLVISMLPARFHVDVARDCITFKKSMITPSYVSHEMHDLDAEAKNAGVLFMNEMGVDPGIDHMSAMRIVDHIRSKGGELTSFKSYCGGLIAPESDTNPWNYKFTWNPRNVVLAGQGGAAQYIDRYQYKYIPYSQIFSRLDAIEIPGYGFFEGYPNRDSLSYRSIYGLEAIPTFYRGTLRRNGYSAAWNIFVQLGMTDDTYAMQGSENLTPRDFLNSFLPYEESVSVEDKMKLFCSEYRITNIDRFTWLGFFDHDRILGLKNATPAQLLEKILVEKLVLEPNDKDMIIMVHQFEYTLNENKYRIDSSMVNLGEDQVYTSMSNTVGLPVAICAKMMLNGSLKSTGVHLPISEEVYAPILDELEVYGIGFNEIETLIS